MSGPQPGKGGAGVSICRDRKRTRGGKAFFGMVRCRCCIAENAGFYSFWMGLAWFGLWARRPISQAPVRVRANGGASPFFSQSALEHRRKSGAVRPAKRQRWSLAPFRGGPDFRKRKVRRRRRRGRASVSRPGSLFADFLWRNTVRQSALRDELRPNQAPRAARTPTNQPPHRATPHSHRNTRAKRSEHAQRAAGQILLVQVPGNHRAGRAGVGVGSRITGASSRLASRPSRRRTISWFIDRLAWCKPIAADVAGAQLQAGQVRFDMLGHHRADFFEHLAAPLHKQLVRLADPFWRRG